MAMTENKGAILAGVGVAGLLLWWLMSDAKADEGCKAPATDQAGKKSASGSCARAGIASNPDFQWLYQVQPGDSPTRITKRYLGTDNRAPVNPSSSAQTAYVELIDANPQQGVTNAAERDDVFARNNPWTTGYNFARLNPGDVLKLPKAWNAYIDEQGNPRGQLAPFPAG